MHLYLDHAWMLELGEGLPAYRPPVDHRLMLAGAQPIAGDGAPGGHAALPDAALEVVDPLRVPGQPAHADAVPRRLRAVDEPAGRRGDRRRATTTGSRRTTATASSSRRVVVSHRVPQGVCLMYHSKDRQIGTPRSEIDGRRGGTENALTTIAMKPTHMIGGYAQLSWAPNYYGPTGLQPRLGHRRAQAQPGGRRTDAGQGAGRDGDEPRQVHRLPHLLGHLQAGLDQPARHRVRVVQQRRDRARARATRASGPTRRAGTAAGSSTARAGCG